MKKQAYSLQVDQPCKEHWAGMTANEQGKYCQRCAKSVIDFTRLSDKEIIRILENSSGKLCGRFNTTQLNRAIVQYGEQRNFSPAYKALTGALLLGSAEAVAGVPVPEQPPYTSSVDITLGDKLIENPSHTGNVPISIKGKITDALTHEPLYSCIIKLKDSDVKTFTDRNGDFAMLIPDELVKDTLIFEIALPEYETREFNVLKSAFFEKSEIELKPDEVMMNKKGMLPQVTIKGQLQVERICTVVGGISVTKTQVQELPVDLMLLHLFR
jgi:hypothetical protein